MKYTSPHKSRGIWSSDEVQHLSLLRGVAQAPSKSEIRSPLKI